MFSSAWLDVVCVYVWVDSQLVVLQLIEADKKAAEQRGHSVSVRTEPQKQVKVRSTRTHTAHRWNSNFTDAQI